MKMNIVNICLVCNISIVKKNRIHCNQKYCSQRCWHDSSEFKNYRASRKKEIYSNIAIANKGKKRSLETRRKMSEAKKKIAGPLHPNWNHDRIEQSKKEKTSKLLHGLVGRALAYLGKKKTGHGQEMLGYTSQELREHIEKQFLKGMTWENHGRGEKKWHVDHIKPISDFGNETTVKEINALSNLRPLWEKENLSLGGKQSCKVRYRRWEK